MTELSPKLLELWEEARARATVVLLTFSVSFCLVFAYSSQLLNCLTTLMGPQTPLTFSAFTIFDVFIPPISLAWYTAWLVSLPVVIVQLDRFVSPALYKQESMRFRWNAVLSIVLFYLGFAAALCLYVPALLHMAQYSTPSNTQFIPNMRLTLETLYAHCFYFGLFFQMPLVMQHAVRLKLLTHEHLASVRRISYLVFFIIGMLITPPDVVSQCLVAIPLCLLFELSVMCTKFCTRTEQPKTLPAAYGVSSS